MTSEPFRFSRRQLSEYAGLDSAKGRRRSGIFVAEGSKLVLELMARFRPAAVYATAAWAEASPDIDTTVVRPAELRQISRLTSLPEVIAIFHLPAATQPSLPAADELVVALDCVQDPGNLGTIIRCCDWMGVKHIVASAETADCFNPKAVQASMGALAHVDISYTDLAAYLAAARDHSTPVYGTFMNGDNIYTANLGPGGILLMGNEGHGIGDACAAAVSRRITIPPFPAGASPVESLNVGVATAIALSQFRSRMQ